MNVSRPRRLFLPAAVYIVILGFSSIPGDTIGGLGLPAGFDYLGHAVEYGALGAALWWALTDVRDRGEARLGPLRFPLVVGLVGVLVLVLGGLDELYQSTVPGRQTSLLDLLVDVAAASLAAYVLARRRVG